MTHIVYNTQATRTRIPCYDMARGIGIILVVIGHALPMDTYARALIYSFHIPLFFFISGSVMKPLTHQRNMAQTIKASLYKERKLFVFYCFYSICFILFDLFYRVLWLHSMDMNGLLWDVYQTVSLYGINVLWFLITLLLAKVLTRIITAICRSINTLLLSAVLLYLFFAFTGNLFRNVCTADTMPLLYTPITAVLETLTMTSFVLIGYALRDAIPQLVEAYPWALSLLLACNILLCFRFGALDYHMLRSGFPPLSLILAFTGILSILGISAILHRIPFVATLLKFYSDNSLFIMVTHEYLLIKSIIIIPTLSLLGLDPILPLQVFILLILEIPICIVLRKPCEHCALMLFSTAKKDTHSPRHANQRKITS